MAKKQNKGKGGNKSGKSSNGGKFHKQRSGKGSSKSNSEGGGDSGPRDKKS